MHLTFYLISSASFLYHLQLSATELNFLMHSQYQGSVWCIDIYRFPRRFSPLSFAELIIEVLLDFYARFVFFRFFNAHHASTFLQIKLLHSQDLLILFTNSQIKSVMHSDFSFTWIPFLVNPNIWICWKR